VIESTFLALLMAATTLAKRPRAGTDPTLKRTVPITSVAPTAQKEQLTAAAAGADDDSQ
jgi:hypothetical protein